MRISTWYQSKGDQSYEQYTEKVIRSLNFGVAGANRILIILQGWPMVFYGLRLKYALEGNSNYIAWKDIMEVVLEGNGLKEFIDQEIQKPTSTNAQELA